MTTREKFRARRARRLRARFWRGAQWTGAELLKLTKRWYENPRTMRINRIPNSIGDVAYRHSVIHGEVFYVMPVNLDAFRMMFDQELSSGG